MKSLLYIGNKLSVHGSNTTAIETLGPMLEREGFHVRYASSKKSKPLRLLDMAGSTLRMARRSHYVLIDTYSTSNFWYAFVVSQLCRMLHVKYIPILHGGELPKRLANNPRLCRMIFGHSHVNVAPSGYLLAAFQGAGFRQTLLISNAIKTADYPFKCRTALKPNLLWVRSLASIYNPQMGLRVLAEIQKDFPEATLCMVGPEKDVSVDSLQQLADALGVTVRFTGRLTKQDWIALSQSYDIFINTTHKDNMPVSVIEAMALGLPVVSTNVGGIPHLIDDQQQGLLVDDNDHMNMAKCVVNLLKDAELSQSLVQNAYKMVGLFDERKIAERWLEILK